MGKHALVVIGPAGSGKSTLCATLAEHYGNSGRSVHVCNFDPAADELAYEASLDLRELIDVDDAMSAKGLGPNGSMVFCMEYLMSNPKWLDDQLGDYVDDFLIADMPGQIEVTSHIPVVPQLAAQLEDSGYKVVVLFVLDGVAATADPGKFVSGCLMSLSSMVCFNCPFVNVLMKCDMLPEQFKEDELEHFAMCDFDHLNLNHLNPKWKALTRSISGIITDFNLVSYQPMDISNVDYVSNFANQLDDLVQYSEDAEVRERDVDMDNDMGIAGLGGGEGGEFGHM